MKDNGESTAAEPARPRFALFKAAVLRAIDACLRALQGLRRRLEAPVDEDEGGRGARRCEVEADATAETVPSRRIGFLHVLLAGLVCLLLGAGAGTWGAYRGMAKIFELRTAEVDRLQDELEVSRKVQTRSVNQMARFQQENAEIRLKLLQAQRMRQDDQARIGDLQKQLAGTPRAERPTAPAAAPQAPPKAGTCAVGTGNAAADLTNCIERFNGR